MSRRLALEEDKSLMPLQIQINPSVPELFMRRLLPYILVTMWGPCFQHKIVVMRPDPVSVLAFQNCRSEQNLDFVSNEPNCVPVTILKIINRPLFYLTHYFSETVFCVPLQVEATHLSAIDGTRTGNRD